LVKRGRVEVSVGFPPIENAAARVLVLGSLPGVKSLQMREYYAQPYNAFWRIMGEIVGAGPELPYPARLVRLRAHGLAVWDVLAAGEREGSLDSSIVSASIVVNDFGSFFEHHRELRLICFNGNTAERLFKRKVLPDLKPEWAAIERRALPSTSPAHASLRFEQKLARWREALRALATPV
jgi:double-stranded uracil-DNA glycosylase